MIAALSQIAANKCRFIVGGRVKTGSAATPTTSFETCSTIMQLPYSEVTGNAATDPAVVSHAAEHPQDTVAEVLPQSVVEMFIGLSEAQFRLDLSSTEIRNRIAQESAASFSSASSDAPVATISTSPKYDNA